MPRGIGGVEGMLQPSAYALALSARLPCSLASDCRLVVVQTIGQL